MTIHTIEKNMIVQTTVELQPEIKYVYASSDCKYLHRLDIPADESGTKSPGTYGSIKSKNIETFKNNTVNVYNVTDRFIENALENGNNILDELERVKNEKTQLSEQVGLDIDNINTDDIITSLADQNMYSKIASGTLLTIEKNYDDTSGLKETNNIFEFKTERLEKKYLIDNPNYCKKKSILNLYKYYKDNIENNNFYDLEWGFRNYNTLNFFNIQDDFNNNFRDDITHKNCLIYPNFREDGVSTYDFSNTTDFSVSFYVNPKRTCKNIFHYNPGCVINIPGVLSVYIVKGSNINANGETSSFRLFFELGEDTQNILSDNFSFFNINDINSQSNNFCYLTKDNILNLNHWHNICFSLNSNIVNNVTNYDASLYVDGEIVENITFELQNLINIQESSFITIGNKLQVSADNKNDFLLHTFSKDNLIIDDNSGPYINKHILLGDNIGSVLNNGSSSDVEYSFKNSINDVNSDYISNETSMALNAELHDIRLYKRFFDVNEVSQIFSRGVEDLQNEILENNLLFYVPVYYTSQNVRKKGLTNLSAPYQKGYVYARTANQSLHYMVDVDEYLTGTYEMEGAPEAVWPESEGDFKVKTQNISYNFPINPFFLNFTGGTDVSVEHFTREFVRNTQPNIVIGGNIKEDRYADCFLAKSSIVLNDKIFNDLSKQGNVPFSLYEYIVKNLSADDLLNIDIDYQSNNISYRNYMILPNDNGLQEQFYSNVFNYKESDYIDCHRNSLGKLDYSFVSLKNINKNFQKKSSIPRNSLIFREFVDFFEKEVTNREDRPLYNFDNNVIRQFSEFFPTTSFIRPIFETECDKLLNISIANHYDDNLTSYVNDHDLQNIDKLSKAGIIDSEDVYLYLHKNTDFYKTLSNPAQRSYYSNIDNTISESDVYDRKQIEDESFISYKKFIMPLLELENDFVENSVSIFTMSTQIFNKEIKRETFTIKDVDMSMSSGLQISFSDTSLGSLYRSDSLTKKAIWNSSGNILYKEGLAVITHPSMFNFGKTNYQIDAKSHTSINNFELNLPASSGKTNKSNNNSYKENLKIDNSAFNADEEFVYITDIDLHDENLNIIASAKLSQPFPKKNSDNVLFRVKMDF